MGETKDYTTIFGKIVLSKFDKMPEWVRVSAFFVALFVMTYVALHSLNAKYFVTGTVLEPSPTHPKTIRVARGYDVRWGDAYAGTNSKGHYVFVLSPTEYASLLKTGGYSLEIWKAGDKEDVESHQLCKKSVKFEWFQSRFEDYRIDDKCSQGDPAESPEKIGINKSPIEYSLVPVAYASVSQENADYRILVGTVRFDPRWRRSDLAEMALFQNGETLQLLNPSGDPYGKISILPGESLAFRDGVYLSSRSLTGGRLRVSVRNGIFSYQEEWFDLSKDMQLGRQSTIRGSWGSELTLTPISRSNITVYRKYGDDAYYSKLSQDLIVAGVMPVSSASPMGADKITNTLFAGTSVKPARLKAVVSAISKNGVQLKRIAYPYKFASTPDTFRLQLGWSAQCVRAPTIPQTELVKLAGILDAQVPAFLEKFKVCKPSTRQGH